MSANLRENRGFTGRHMLISILAFFGVVIAVNVTMATLASTSWTGLVVENTYVASQQFNKKAEEGRIQAALGWTGRLTIAGGEVRYALVDRSGNAVSLKAVKVLFRHPAYEAEDRAVTLSRAPDSPSGEFAARHTPKDGVWIVEIDADAGQAEPYRDVRRLQVVGGAVR